MATTSVVILNWNGKQFLERFLPVLIQYSSEAEIIIADNASTDNSVDFLRTFYPQIKIIQNEKNLGFAGGYNAALSKVDSKYYVLLNSDIEVTENWLIPLIQTLETDQTIAACQPKILDYHKRNKFEYAGASGGFIDSFGFPFCRGRLFNTTETDHGQYDDPIDVFWATGACLAVRADVYHRLEGFDKDFFAHMEEIDFCWRLHNHGYRVCVVPQSKIFHIGGGTLPKNSARKTYFNFRNNYLLLYKNLLPKKKYKILTIRLFLDWLAALKFLSEGHLGDFAAVFKAQFHTYLSFRKHSYKRLKNPYFSEKFIYKGSIIYDYFIRKKRKFSQLDMVKFQQ